jgi:hypothetical protein
MAQTSFRMAMSGIDFVLQFFIKSLSFEIFCTFTIYVHKTLIELIITVTVIITVSLITTLPYFSKSSLNSIMFFR